MMNTGLLKKSGKHEVFHHVKEEFDKKLKEVEFQEKNEKKNFRNEKVEVSNYEPLRC